MEGQKNKEKIGLRVKFQDQINLTKNIINIEERSPIWIALSEFYLDRELEEEDIRNIALKVIQSTYSLEEVKEINKYEVFPILKSNLLSVAGEWAGFHEEWLINRIQRSLEKRNTFKRIIIEILYPIFKVTFNHYIKKLENVYKQINTK